MSSARKVEYSALRSGASSMEGVMLDWSGVKTPDRSHMMFFHPMRSDPLYTTKWMFLAQGH